MITIQNIFESLHPGYAYQLLQLQIAVQTSQSGCQVSSTEILHLIRLYTMGVEVLESLDDGRYRYFENKLYGLMVRKQVVRKLKSISEVKQWGIDWGGMMSKSQLNRRRSRYQMNCFVCQDEVNIKNISQMVNLVASRQSQTERKIRQCIKNQQDRLEERIKQRKIKSETRCRKKIDDILGEGLHELIRKKLSLSEQKKQDCLLMEQNGLGVKGFYSGIVRTSSTSLSDIFCGKDKGNERKFTMSESESQRDKTDSIDAI